MSYQYANIKCKVADKRDVEQKHKFPFQFINVLYMPENKVYTKTRTETGKSKQEKVSSAMLHAPIFLDRWASFAEMGSCACSSSTRPRPPLNQI